MTQTTQNNQQKLKNLLKTRKQIVQRITQLEKRKYLLQDHPKIPTNNIIQNHQNNIHDQPQKRVKKDQQINAQNNFQINHPKNTNPQENLQQNNTIKKLKEIQNKRNRKLFGGLNLHLQKANVKQNQDKQKRQKMLKIHQEIQQKQKQKNNKFIKQEIDKIKIELKNQQKIKNQNSKSILKIENILLLQNYQNYSNNLKPFTFTKTQPSISWKPINYKGIGILIKQLFDERQKNAQQKYNHIVQSIQKYQNQFDYSKYLRQNQSQYYSNIINKYYQNINHFLSTKTQPHILWKTSKNNNIQNNTSNLTQSIINHNKNICDQYYTEKTQKIQNKKNEESLSNHQL